MIFSDRLLFLHVPKAGGTSIIHYLMQVLPKPVYYSLPADHVADVPDGVTRFHGVAHESLEEARLVLAQHGRRIEEFPVVVACIRNPYELEVSRYSFLRRDREKYNHGPQQAIAFIGDFELFAMCSRPHGQRRLESYFVLEGTVPPNLHIIRLEDVQSGLTDCLVVAGAELGTAHIPHHNRSKHDPFQSYYTAAAEEAVYEKYKWVFDSGLYPRLDVDGERSSTPRFSSSEDVERLVESRLSALSGRRDDFARANVWLAAAEIHRYWLRSAAQDQALERALDHALSLGSDHFTARIANELARCRSLSGLGSVDDGIARCTALHDTTLQTLGSGGRSLVLAELLAGAGRLDEARAVCEEVRAHSPELALSAASCAGSVELLAGNEEAAEQLFGHGWWNPLGLAADRAEALYRRGLRAEVIKLVTFTELTAPADDARAQARWRRMRAKLLANSDHAPAAVGLAREAVAIAQRCEAPNLQADALVDLAEVLGSSGRANESIAALKEALLLYERKGNVASARRTAEFLRTRRSASVEPPLSSPAS